MDHMSNSTAITFKINDRIIRDNIDLGILQKESETDFLEIKINHNSNKPIVDCGLFISPYDNYYNGTKTKEYDFEKILWFADNYPGYGLCIKQDILLYGEVYRQDSRRLVDISRKETRDIFTGSEIEMLSGFSNGEKRTVTSYDTVNNLFTLNDNFTAALEGDRYKIQITTEHIVKSKLGSSSDYPIPLLYNAGVIQRFEEASIKFKLKIPEYIKESGNHLFTLNIKYTPGDLL